MKKAKIFYFSGTGNTEYIVKLAEAEFKEHGLETEIFKIEKFTKGEELPLLGDTDIIGLATPVYGFDSPKLIRDFVKLLPNCEERISTFVFKTGASYATLNSSTAKREIRMLSKKGYHVIYERIFAMPSNWGYSFSEYHSKKVTEVNVEKVKQSCSDIVAGKERTIVNPLPIKLLGQFTNWGEEQFGARFFGKMLKANDLCTQCGKCSRECPTGNISINEKGVSFHWNCLWCMKCIYNCPTNAIIPGMAKFCVLKEGYSLKQILESNPTEETLPPAFQKYVDNLDL